MSVTQLEFPQFVSREQQLGESLGALKVALMSLVIEFHDLWEENTEGAILTALDDIHRLLYCTRVREPEKGGLQ